MMPPNYYLRMYLGSNTTMSSPPPLDINDVIAGAVLDGNSQTFEFKEISLDNKKRYICKNIWNLSSVSDVVCIGSIIVQAGYAERIKDNSEGCLINLDTLPAAIIDQIYTKISLIINSEKDIIDITWG